MTKKHFIALADAIKKFNYSQSFDSRNQPFTLAHLGLLASFCESQNAGFERDRWFAYIAGE